MGEKGFFEDFITLLHMSLQELNALYICHII